MEHNKIKQIADSIHGTILISSFEKQIISTQVFNRLHSILQNSTVFLTYPTNQTKRFEHSLGVMHLAGKMFFHSMVNADENIRNEFLNQINNELDRIKHDVTFMSLLNAILGDEYTNLIENCKSIIIDDPLYMLNMPYVISKEHIFAFTLVFQSVRLAALLHDVGHPPFSHVTEFALKGVWKEISGIEPENRNVRKQNFVTAIETYSNQGNDDLHEKIGNFITELLIQSVTAKSPLSEEEAKRILFYTLVNRTIKHILSEEPKIFGDIHGIISASIDSDRLDYVTRDLINSGFSHGTIEYDRLISSMKLMNHEGDYLFCFDIGTLGTIEDFFYRRWFLYKHVIYHHRVVKTDYLLENIIGTLSRHYLEQNVSDNLMENQGIPLDISGLWRAVKAVFINKKFFNSLIQWDDSWLMTVLRREFFAKYCDQTDLIRYQLEELLSNKKYYRSMIKKMDAFLKIDKIVIENLVYKFDLIPEDIIKNREEIIETIKRQKMNFQNGNLEEYLSQGFFLNSLKKFFVTIGLYDSFEGLIKQAIKQIAYDKYNVKDCIVVFKKQKTGLEKNFPHVHQDGQVFILKNVSRIDSELRLNLAVFPLFFVYVFENEKINHGEFLCDIGKQITNQLMELLNSKISLSE